MRTILMFAFWTLAIPLGALVAFPHVLVTRRVDFLYRVGTWIGITGVRLAGVSGELIALDRLDMSRSYIFMSNHVSNLDPPLLIPLLPRRVSVLVKKELFRIPIVGRAMRMGSFIPIDRRNREAAIVGMRAAVEQLRQGIDMVIFPEGTRSRDGRLQPFKKGPFYLAIESAVPIVPLTILGTEWMLPKGNIFVKPGRARIVFHPPVVPSDFPHRDALMAAVRDAIASALPADRQ